MKYIRIVSVTIILLIGSSFSTVKAKPEYKMFIPQVGKGEPYFGLAMAVYSPTDLAALGVNWYYFWNPSSKTPMLWFGVPSPEIPADYASNILVFNEPNMHTQGNFTPQEAAKLFLDLRIAYPRAHLICCGASAWAVQWVKDFWAAGGRPDSWHVHAHVEGGNTPEKNEARIAQMHALTGGNYWITEYSSFNGVLAEFQHETEWFLSQPWITRIAPYTNRQPHSGETWEVPLGVEMFEEDGDLTPIGNYYRNVATGNPE